MKNLSFNKIFIGFNVVLVLAILLWVPLAYFIMHQENEKCVKCIHDNKCRISTYDKNTDKTSSVEGKTAYPHNELKYYYYNELTEEEKVLSWRAAYSDYKYRNMFYQSQLCSSNPYYTCGLNREPNWKFSYKKFNIRSGTEALIVFFGFFINFCLWIILAIRKKKLIYLFVALFFVGISITSLISWILPALHSASCATA